MPREFDAAITTYREAERLCQTLSGNALHAAQDEEAEALDDWLGRQATALVTSEKSSRCCRGSCRKDVGSMDVTSSYSTAFGGT